MDYTHREELLKIFLLGKFLRVRLMRAFKMCARGAWLAPLEEPETLDLQPRIECRDCINKQINLK